MARRVVSLHPKRSSEGREARNWYRERSQDVEERFRVALRRAIREIREVPRTLAGGRTITFRSYRIAGFPYRLIYWTEGDYSLVVAIAHSDRHPGYWKARLGPPK